ncbi:fatty-acid amide hydrolase 2-B-like [Musca vetustissima]|uniref:fatty-acid amide hydrolase 2-B-like n=1 Tax=Musca vetustissima TaxID=27455 RepID=UPI002AB6F9EA|nr:fatty-acid amide hydrolase 2-B-like [Musca vetustissima]
MEFVLRLLQFIVKIVYNIVYIVLAVLFTRKKDEKIPAIKDRLVTIPLVDIVELMRTKRLTSQELVKAYIERLKEVNPHINAIVEDRFEEALTDAKRADDLIFKCANSQLPQLYARYPLLGIPFTVKEACGLKGMSFVVGSLQRVDTKAKRDCIAVENLKSAGAIPLLVSANPEYCFSIETNSYTNGKCLNAYDFRRTCGGSSGGEGALNGSGATLFGIGSDIAGSIRIPSLFNGVFGHKPTGGLIPNIEVFPSSDDEECNQYLQTGVISRFGSDLGLILHIMAGEHARKLEFVHPIETKDIKIFYSLGFSGLNGICHYGVTAEIQIAILKAVKCLQQSGLTTQIANIKGLENSTEIAFSGIARLKKLPLLMDENTSVKELLQELMKSYVKKSKYTKEGLTFELLRRTNAFMNSEKLMKYKEEGQKLKQEIINLLGNDGVLFFPTFPVPAIHHHTSSLAQWGIDYSLLFNILGLPCTHIPMGVDADGMPVGFQVIAAPFKDKLCLQIAGALEMAFGGWTPPVKHAFS